MSISREAKLEQIAQRRQRDVILVLENIHDPHNAAAICRSADSFGIQHIWLICETVPQWDLFELGKKSSAFTSKWMSFRTFNTTLDCLRTLKERDFSIYSTILDAEAESLLETDFIESEKIALIMGNEHEGISEAVIEATDHKLFIPMTGFAQSLNVSVATAVCLWELFRQRDSSNTDYSIGEDEQGALLLAFEAKQHEKKLRRHEKKRKGRVKRIEREENF